MELKPKILPVKKYFNMSAITHKDINEGMLISFNYLGDKINDYFPFIYVLEKKMDRIYGFNLRYASQELIKIINLKEKEIKKELDEQFKIIKKNNPNLNLEKESIIKELKKEIPIDILKFFQHNVTTANQNKILRNYIIKNIKKPTIFVYKTK